MMNQHYSMKSILFISPRPPLPPNNGGRQRTHLLINELARFYSVDLLLTCPPSDIEDISCLQQASSFKFLGFTNQDVDNGSDSGSINPLKWAFNILTKGVDFYYRHHELSDELSDYINKGNYDAIFYRYVEPMYHVPISHRTIILDLDDYLPESYRLRCKKANGRNWLKKPYLYYMYKTLSKIYANAFANCNTIITSLESDRSHIKSKCQIIQIQNIPFPDNVANARLSLLGTAKNVIFVGSMNHPPNVNGINKFIDDQWPFVLSSKALSDSELLIIGRGGTNLSSQVNRISHIQNAESLDLYYQSSICSIAPLDSGAGTNIKVMESLTYGIPVIATEFALRGIVRFGYHPLSIQTYSSTNEFIEKLGNLRRLSNDDLYNLRMTTRARAMTLYSHETFKLNMNPIINAISSNPRTDSTKYV